jgi:hypothetical protein
MNKETLEDAAERLSERHHYAFGQQSEFYQLGFIEGAKYQADRMNTEEDMIEFAFNTYHYISELMGVPFRQVSENKLHVMYNLEQYKKK